MNLQNLQTKERIENLKEELERIPKIKEKISEEDSNKDVSFINEKKEMS